MSSSIEEESVTSCCSKKSVGNFEYNLVDHDGSTEGYNCMNSCVYEKTGFPGSKFCFAKGNQDVSCLDKAEE